MSCAHCKADANRFNTNLVNYQRPLNDDSQSYADKCQTLQMGQQNSILFVTPVHCLGTSALMLASVRGARVTAHSSSTTGVANSLLWRDLVRGLCSVPGINVNLQNHSGETALFLAVDTDQFHIVQELLNQGANPNLRTFSGETALSLATKNNQQGIVQALRAAGAM